MKDKKQSVFILLKIKVRKTWIKIMTIMGLNELSDEVFSKKPVGGGALPRVGVVERMSEVFSEVESGERGQRPWEIS